MPSVLPPSCIENLMRTGIWVSFATIFLLQDNTQCLVLAGAQEIFEWMNKWMSSSLNSSRTLTAYGSAHRCLLEGSPVVSPSRSLNTWCSSLEPSVVTQKPQNFRCSKYCGQYKKLWFVSEAEAVTERFDYGVRWVQIFLVGWFWPSLILYAPQFIHLWSQAGSGTCSVGLTEDGRSCCR